MVTKKTNTKKVAKKAAKKTAKKKTVKKIAGRKTAKRRMPGWMILLAGIVFGLVIAVFGYINGWVPKPKNPNKPIPEVTSEKNHARVENNAEDKIEDKIDEIKVKPQKDYDFYDNLPGMQVEIDDTQQTNNREVAKKQNLLIQIGSFKNQSDAESIKAKVAFSGFSAKIKPVTVNDATWYRVIIGPYSSPRKADVDKRKLQNNDFEPIIIKQ